MATTIPYSAREYDVVLNELKTALADQLPESNDFLDSNVGRWMISVIAAIADMINFNLDRQAAECFIDTVETRTNLTSLLKLIGFQPSNPVPAQGGVIFSTNDPVASDLLIRRYTELFAPATGQKWTTFSDAVIPAGKRTSGLTLVRQGSWVSLSSISSGAKFQRLLISSQRVAEGLIRVFVDSIPVTPGETGDVEWSIADHNTFAGHGPNDQVFRIVNLPDKRVVVEFGDDIEGMIPPKGSSIRVDYFDTDGVNGSSKANEITRVTTSLPVTVNVTNPGATTVGFDFETVASARLRYPGVFKTMRRAVTLRDWEALAGVVPGVLQAVAVDQNLVPSMDPLTVRVYVLGNGNVVSSALNRQVSEQLNKVKIVTVRHQVVSPYQVRIKIKASITVDRRFDTAEVLSNVESALSDYFVIPLDSRELGIGKSVYRSKLVTAAQMVTGVVGVEMIILRTPPPLGSEPDNAIRNATRNFQDLELSFEGLSGNNAQIIPGAPSGQVRVTGLADIPFIEGQLLTLSNATHPSNNGTFEIAKVINPQTVDIINPDGVFPDDGQGGGPTLGAIVWFHGFVDPFLVESNYVDTETASNPEGDILIEFDEYIVPSIEVVLKKVV